ncbi:MAG: carbohydrate ABC transporter permease [Trueperaceae bacterium]|nr:carbohydrate ABC transporter permease [Trueperaceae bacterium]
MSLPSLKRQRRGGDVITYTAYLAILVFFLVPLAWLVSLSIRTPAEIFVSELRLWPEHPTLQNYLDVLGSRRFLVYLWNGMKLAVIGAGGAMLVASPAAYAFSRFRFPLRQPLLIGILTLQMISPLVIMVPLYRYMERLNLLDSHLGAGMVYVAIAVPLFTWMLKGFLDGIPPSLEEAAMVDGSTRFGAFLRIILPLSLPGLTAAFILNAILGWSQFVIPYILINSPDLLPISVGIFNYQGTMEASSTHLLATASVLTVLPAVAIFLLLQRFIVGALLAGAVKG